MKLGEAQSIALRMAKRMQRPSARLVLGTTSFTSEPVYWLDRRSILITPAALEVLNEESLTFALARTLFCSPPFGKRNRIRWALATSAAYAPLAVWGFAHLGGPWNWLLVLMAGVVGPLPELVHERLVERRDAKADERTLRALNPSAGAEAYYRALREFELHGEHARVRENYVLESEIILRTNLERIHSASALAGVA